jgi:uncharacterized protein YihD (DUF1040 family)
MRDPKRIPRILKKLETAWKEYPDMRLIQLLLFLGKDEDRNLDAFYIEDRHLEEVLDNKKSKPKLQFDYDHLFSMSHRMASDEMRSQIEAFVRDTRAMSVAEFMKSASVYKMDTKDWYAAEIPDYRIVFRVSDTMTIELLDIVSEASIKAFKKCMDKEKKKA